MRKREIKLNNCKKYYTKTIAMVFVPNRFSQKLGRWQDIDLPVNQFVVRNADAKLIPFNFKNYKNPNTLIKRLSEFDYVLVHETDIDVIEKLRELNIDFRILPIEIKKGCLERKADRLSYVSNDWYIESNFLSLYEITPKTEIYYILKNEYTYPRIERVIINPKTDRVSPWMYKTKKEVYNTYVNRLKTEISNYSKTLQSKKELLEYFISEYEGEM